MHEKQEGDRREKWQKNQTRKVTRTGNKVEQKGRSNHAKNVSTTNTRKYAGKQAENQVGKYGSSEEKGKKVALNQARR